MLFNEKLFSDPGFDEAILPKMQLRLLVQMILTIKPWGQAFLIKIAIVFSFFLILYPVEACAGSLEPLAKLVRSADKALSRSGARLVAPSQRVYEDWKKRHISKDEENTGNKKTDEGFVLNGNMNYSLFPQSTKPNADIEQYFDAPTVGKDSSPLVK